jgi:tetratricopeptide (TPR) repeat protein
MQAERWHQIDAIFHSALNVEESRRAAFLRETCSGDEGLRLELERLLSLESKAENFLETPAMEVAAQMLSNSGGASDAFEADLAGQTISHYRILSKLGGGGMGVVYEAEDIRLGRRVALKFLPADLARHPGALQRFEGEARAASSLNHANICTIHEVEEHNGQPVIVMELLEGESLRQRIRKGPVSLRELLDIGLQIADALEAAHAKGIAHRDIKPENIFLVAGGRVKVLDFGLAKAISAPAVDRSAEESLTYEGVIAGTASYMSPEQVCGEDIDGRSDLFSVGIVLYELATARQPFARANSVLTIDAILNAQPPAAASLNPELPAELDRILARLLEKDRELRYASASGLGLDLKRFAGTAAPAGPRPFPGRKWKFAAAACLAAMATAACAYFLLHGGHPLGASDTIVLAEFENKTADPVFDGTLRQALAVQLEQSPFLSLVSEERIQRALHLMSRTADARLTPEVAREICERTGGAAVVEGSIASLGNQYVLWLRARNCRAGDVLFEAQAQSGKKEEVLNALSRMVRNFRTRAGEPLSTVERYSTPLPEVTTTSLEALKVYGEARRIHTSIGGTAALPLYERAIALDPRFAMAYATLGHLYAEIGETDVSAENIRKAWEFRDRSSDVEKFFITAAYELRVLGNTEKLQATCEAWARSYPREVHAHGLLAGGVYPVNGNFEKAFDEARKAIELDPDWALGYALVADYGVSLRRLSEAQRVLEQAVRRKLEVPEFLESRHRIAFMKGDRAGMERELARSRQKPETEAALYYLDSFALAYYGRLRQARIETRHAFDLAEQSGQRERAGLYAAGAAVREALFGNVIEARRSANIALALSTDREVEYGTAFALALAGDGVRAQGLADDLEKRFPEDTSVRFNYLPVIRACLELSGGNVSRAIALLQVTVPHELGMPRSAFHGVFGALYPIYLRGEARLKARDGAGASREFQKVLDHLPIVLGDPIGAVARLQLSRAFVMDGDAIRAKAAYRGFLALWRDADPEIPIMKQANAEYARLQ